MRSRRPCGAARTIRIATRASRLAMVQAELVLAALRAAAPGVAFEMVAMSTSGDRAGGLQAHAVGVFVKELEHALLDDRCDLAVHSLKDVPTRLPDGLTLGAFPTREDPRDVVVVQPPAAPGQDGTAAPGEALAALAPGARIGTTSLRRWVQLRQRRRDLRLQPLRGNVETRLRRLEEGHCDALVLAGAGLVRLGLQSRIRAWLSPEELVPAPGQGTLAVECRSDDAFVLEQLARIDQPALRVEAAAERAFMATTEAGCRWPVGAWAHVEWNGLLTLTGFVALPETTAPAAPTAQTLPGPALPAATGTWRSASDVDRAELALQSGEAPAGAAELGRRLALRLMATLQAGQGERVNLDAP